MYKFIVAVDYKAEFSAEFGDRINYIELTAKNVVEAMNQAEENMNECVYLAKLMQRTSKKVSVPYVKADSRAVYEDILVNRGNGWYACDSKHNETPYENTMVKYDDDLAPEVYDWQPMA